MENEVSSELLDIDRVGGMLFRSTPNGLVVVDIDGVIHLINPSLGKMFGYDPTELMGKKIDFLIPELKNRKHPKLQYHFSESNPNVRNMGLEVQGKRKDGSTFPLQVKLNGFSYKNHPWVMGIILEVSERNRFLEELKRERRTAQMYLDTASTLFVLVNKNQKVQLINKMGCKMLGYEESDILGKNWFDNFIPSYQTKEVKKVFEQMMNGDGKSYQHYENYIVNRQGEERLIDWNNIIIHDDDGSTIGTLSSGVDITEKRQAEKELIQLYTKLEYKVKERTKELEESQRLYQTIAHNFPNGDINVLDKNLDYVFAEGTGIYNRGLTGKMLIGKSFLRDVDKKQKPIIEKKLNSVLHGENTEFELTIGDNVHLISASGLPDLNNEINQILVVSQDITRLKRAEEQTQVALQKEMKLNELKSRFVSMASHEFRTPLTSILNSSSLINRYVGLPEYEQRQKNHLNRIKTSVHHLTNILNDFLSLDKLEEGKVEINHSLFNIREFSTNLIEEMEGIKKRDQEIVYEHVGKQEVSLDKNILKTIYNNLISNAVKYSPEASTVYLKTNVKNGALKIVIKDQGIGIPKDEQEHLFERFYRAKNALNIQGTGLGLNIVKKYVDMIEGDISFQSEPEIGTTFTLQLPVNYK